MEGVNDEGRTQREINEGGDAGRGRAWSKRGRGCWREGIKEEGGSEGGIGRLGQDRQGKQGGEEGGKDRSEGDTNDQGQAWLCTEACQWLLAFTLY